MDKEELDYLLDDIDSHKIGENQLTLQDKLTEIINILEDIDVSELQQNDQLEIVKLKERCLLLFYSLSKKKG